ncbi:MAG: hypothetical protein HY751_05720 [Nitrospinae bacterium]|nr:hypothetical protein [Nitrospinota bacterium]
MISQNGKNGHGAKVLALYVLSGVLFVTATLIYVYPSIRATALMYEYSANLKKLADLRELNKKMKLEVSSRRSFDLIENRAVRELGYVFPTRDQVVIIAKR